MVADGRGEYDLSGAIVRADNIGEGHVPSRSTEGCPCILAAKGAGITGFSDGGACGRGSGAGADVVGLKEGEGWGMEGGWNWEDLGSGAGADAIGLKAVEGCGMEGGWNWDVGSGTGTDIGLKAVEGWGMEAGWN